MRSGASESDLLAARDARAALVARLCARRDGGGPPTPPRALVFASLAVPGPKKTPEGAGVALASGVDALRRALADRPWEELDRGTDALGPWAVVAVEAEPEPVKRAAARIEGAFPFGRVLDLDVYADGGRPVDRAGLGLPPRRCLVCEEPARECIALRRHRGGEPAARAAAILEPLGPWRSWAAALAAALVEGAQEELDLTPKPGLVDRHDSGSHPDLSYAAMVRSVLLLPLYFDELVALRGPAGADAGARGDLAACVAAGRRAEARMHRAAGSNAHRGLIFLGGLVVLAACDASPDGEQPGEGTLRRHVTDLAREFCERAEPDAEDTPGARARSEHGVQGILGEARTGLPAVFEAALPAYRATLARSGDRRRAALRAMAALMGAVDDTTALHRAGRGGLARLRSDGESLAALLDAGADPDAHLARWNDDYRRAGLTMGGVADCLALTLAFARSTRSSTTRLACRLATIPARGAIGVMPLGDSLSSSPQR
jgi:triphosphoribosyl-dephospho-CoA synthase